VDVFGPRKVKFRGWLADMDGPEELPEPEVGWACERGFDGQLENLQAAGFCCGFKNCM
jgi:hypothetical protein